MNDYIAVGVVAAAFVVFGKKGLLGLARFCAVLSVVGVLLCVLHIMRHAG